MYSYQLLKLVSDSNPTITHFLIRMYRKGHNTFRDEKGAFKYDWLSVADLESLDQKITNSQNDNYMVGLTSLVMTELGIRSLLMIDFAVAQSETAENELVEKISTFHRSGDAPYSMEGWIIKTNASYHYLGTYLVSSDHFRHFLGSALLFRHDDQDYFVTDDRWLGHTLKKGYGTIRISRKNGGEYPTVIREIK